MVEVLVIEQLLFKMACFSLVHVDVVRNTEAIVNSFIVEALND